MAECIVTAERGALVTVTGAVDAPAAECLRACVAAFVDDPAVEVVAVDLTAATRCDPTLFEVLAHADAALLARRARMVVTGLPPEVLSSLAETDLWAVFTLYRAARQRSARAAGAVSAT